MADINNRSRLQDEAIEKREELVGKNRYVNTPDKMYTEESKDARSDGDPLGKGTGVPLGVAPRPGEINSKAISYANMDTTAGGGLYDIKGRNGVGGRDRLMAMNLYGPNDGYNYHGQNMVDTTENVRAGQYVFNTREIN